MSRSEAPPPRMPQPARPPRMGRLSTLPLFFALDGKRVVVAGGNEAAAWKAELLSAAGATAEGAAPVFGQAIRSRIEAPLPAGFARWVRSARAWRDELQALRLRSTQRRRFWEEFATLALREPDRAPNRQDYYKLLRKGRGGGG